MPALSDGSEYLVTRLGCLKPPPTKSEKGWLASRNLLDMAAQILLGHAQLQSMVKFESGSVSIIIIIIIVCSNWILLCAYIFDTDVITLDAVAYFLPSDIEHSPCIEPACLDRHRWVDANEPS